MRGLVWSLFIQYNYPAYLAHSSLVFTVNPIQRVISKKELVI